MPVEVQRIVSEFGIEVTESLVWQGWEPGREYTKNITLKNVNQKTKKLKYRIPGTKFFITKYPQPIILSSGKSINLPVTFRPLEKNIYEDSITFHTQEGQFLIPMKATLPQSKLVLPNSVHFGMAAVKDQVEETFEMLNLSNVKTMFNFDEMEGPFGLVPTSGTVPAKGKAIIKATFKPEAAHVYQFDAVCHFNPESEEHSMNVISLEGIGKFPYLCVKNKNQSGNCFTVDFSSCPVGKEKSEVLELSNMTPVNAPFLIMQSSLDKGLDEVFSCSKYHGVIPRSGSTTVKINFKATIPDMSYSDELKILAVGTPGASVIRCIGRSVAPFVTLKAKYVNFGVTTVGDTVTRSFQLINTMGTPAVFQFQTDNQYSAFELDVISGEVKANSSRTVVVNFVPSSPINYYKKLVCLIHNQGPFYIHLFGTCHSEQRKPELLQRHHLERYDINAERGLTRLPPEELHQLKEEGKIIVKDDGTLEAVDELLLSDLHQEPVQLSAMETFFNDGTAGELRLTVPHVCADVRHVDFGRSEFGETFQKTINITNHTKGKVSCCWMPGKDKPVFTVTPEEQDILPLTSASFRVTFKPNAPAQFFGSELEAYIYFKSMRDHKLVKDYTFCPPWCISLGAYGHTFPERSETFVPKCKWDSSNVVLPPVSQSQASYKTTLLHNTGSNPVHYELETGISSVFSCKPSIGLCKGPYQVVVFRMVPSPPGLIKETLKRKINASDSYTEMVTLIGTSQEPAVELKPKDVVYFKPTCIGTQSSRNVTVKNVTRVPLRFQWTIPKKDREHFKAADGSGIIQPHETQNHTWLFTPSMERRHLCKVILSVMQINESDGTTSSYTLRLVGEGQTGSISAEEGQVDFGNVIVGTTSKRELVLRNESECSLYYQLTLQQLVKGPYGDEETCTDAVVLEMNHYTFLLPARAKKSVQLTVYPARRVEYSCQLYYELLATVDEDHFCGKVVKTKRHLCDITVKGVYPALFVSDVRASGCLQLLSKSRLWELFSLERFNTYLDGDPSQEELRYTVATRHSTRRRMPVHTRAVLDFNFNSAPHGADFSIMYLCVENQGASEAEWMFLFPTDLQLEMEYWSQTGQFDEDELHEMFVMDHQLFSIEPRKGCLDPGESVVVILTYSHASVGTHKLPVLFKITRGREILLNFLGTTLDPNITYLHFSSFSHTFTPLPIGDITPPVQRYQLHNGGAQTVHFELDLTALDRIQTENCNWRVFECLTPRGRILPGAAYDLIWIFSPLEPKMYIVDVPVHVIGGETSLITFTGVGYDPSVLGVTMSLMDSGIVSIPTKQIVPVPEQLMYLSIEGLDFGNFPIFTKNRRALFLENRSMEYTVSFNWKLPEGVFDQVITIEPSHGHLEPGGTSLCKVTLYSEGLPSIYNLDVICEVVNETVMAEYNKDLIQWHERQEEKRHLFTITEDTLKQQEKKQKQKEKRTDKGLNGSESDLKKYNALPPIGASEENMIDAFKSFQEDPIPFPPRTFIVHLSVQGRSFSVENFRTTFSDLVDYHFPKRAMRAPVSTPLPAPTGLKTAELETLQSSLKMMIRDILIDKDFKESLKLIQEEPIPYFGMLSTQKMEDSWAGKAGTFPHHITRDKVNDQRPIEAEKQESHLVSPVAAQPQTLPAKMATIPPVSQVDSATWEEIGTAPKISEVLKRSEETRHLLESILENTIYNIITEASCGEISLTARPRLVILPPSAKGKRTQVPSNS